MFTIVVLADITIHSFTGQCSSMTFL